MELAGTLALGRLSQAPAVEETFSTCLLQDTATTRQPERPRNSAPKVVQAQTFQHNQPPGQGPHTPLYNPTRTVTASPCGLGSPGEDPGIREGKPSTCVSFLHRHGDDTHLPGGLFKDVPGAP